MKRVRKLKEDNKHLEGKIDEQKKTKKFLKELFLQQTTNKMEQPTQQVREQPPLVLLRLYENAKCNVEKFRFSMLMKFEFRMTSLLKSQHCMTTQ